MKSTEQNHYGFYYAIVLSTFGLSEDAFDIHFSTKRRNLQDQALTRRHDATRRDCLLYMTLRIRSKVTLKIRPSVHGTQLQGFWEKKYFFFKKLKTKNV